MPASALTIRELNRATLARQLLLERETRSPEDALERLGGIQAQLPQPPFAGLWSRLTAFEADDLRQAYAKREVVRATWIRGTLHTVTARDFLRFRAALQPMLSAGWEGIARRRRGSTPLDFTAVLAAVTDFLAGGPRTFAEISAFLASRCPEVDVGTMRYAARMHLPMAQVPGDERWSFPGNPRFTLATEWLGRPIGPSGAGDIEELVMRYLGAFGPGTPADMQTWSGMTGLAEAFERLRDRLVSYGGKRGAELFDMPGVPLPGADIAAPVRFLPEFDNLLLAHRDRKRVIADEHRKAVYLPALRVAATVLVDGFVAATWSVERTKGGATLSVRPFEELSDGDRRAVTAEAERLLGFIEPEARTRVARVAPA